MHPKRLENPRAKCPSPSDKALRAMVKAAWDAGWWCEKAGSGHFKCYSVPSEASRGAIVTVANTPSDRRTIPNTLSALRRAGLKV